MTKTRTKAIILFARDPVIGQVKTRLQPLLDPESVLKLYTCFLNDSIEKICKLESADRFIGVTPSDLSGFFSRLDNESALQIFTQEGKDLGEKMSRAFKERFREGYEQVVIIGSDSPSLPVAYIEQALNSKKDLTIGPSTDGGYYLIGMSQKPVNVFEGVAWGSDKVLAQTLERIKKNGSSLELLPPWYDVDRPEDLKFLETHLGLIEQSGPESTGATGNLLNELDLK
ncbi:MAG: hypothetical protein NPINA01_30030 [Nitrospinaceae bacterium]|nr:MAG: hypothetical protein NPINA01_30030 [Nitrospinaceae bacterium]